MFRISIIENENVETYTQTVQTLDLMRVIQAINTPPPPAPPKKKVRSDAGKPRKAAAQPAPATV